MVLVKIQCFSLGGEEIVFIYFIFLARSIRLDVTNNSNKSVDLLHMAAILESFLEGRDKA